MKLVPFKTSSSGSIGIELEFQIINPNSFSLISRSKDLIRSIQNNKYSAMIKPEITQSMIEINSSIHYSIKDMLDELNEIKIFLLQQAYEMNVLFCGGGTHPFQKWSMQKIFPSVRYKNLSHIYRFLSKRSTVFGQHIHIGCKNADDAIYLTHALARYVPQLIAMCASSPFYQSIDTGYHSSRLTIFSSFPSSGVIPYLTQWEEFSDYFFKMRNLKIISSMKDLYWDIRPKPEFGTVEVRVCDTPLTIKKAVIVTAYIQALALYLLEEKPFHLSPDLYYLYTFNRFQACRYGFEGNYIDPNTHQRYLILDDILNTMKKIERYANQLNSMPYLSQLMTDLVNKKNDATVLRQIYKQVSSFTKVVDQQCTIWSSDS